ncbi:FAD-binding and (Fe-S)-binding domain-containing protein [Ramlibacter sp. MMS24-I3-19]|uniref:FAD-binding and (Fe-S)-binding domain-containing protein n=1 Tax=Ramlibacter sp. MMS24-I3-19 TaxID=3416606 RepID=UPI003D024FB3
MTRNPPEIPSSVDVQALERDLRASVKGEVRFDDGSRALYATDASNYRQVPIGVVIPLDADDVVATVAACRKHDAPVLSRGGGTSLCGQSCNVAVLVDFTKHMHRVLEIDVSGRTALVEPGCVLDDLRERAGAHGLTFAPDPATHSHNTLGGMIGNNSCGPHSVMGGETVHNVIELEILTYDGLRLWVGGPGTAERLRSMGGRPAQIATALAALAERHGAAIREKFPDIPRRVSGFNLPALLPENGLDVAKSLVGSEGTCVVVLQARLRLLPNPPCRALVVLGYDSVADAADDVPAVMRSEPIALEGMDDRLVKDIQESHLHVQDLELLPPGQGWLIVEFGGDTPQEADARAKALADSLCRRDKPPAVKFVKDPQQEQRIWKIRESSLGATAHVPGKAVTWEGWEDSSVPPANLGKYLRGLRALLDRYGYGCDLYGHFGQGCVHTRIDFDLESQPGIDKFRRFLFEAAHLVVSVGGSISGEHGDGQSKAELLPVMFGPELVHAFEEFKAIWDPRNRMNPGKVVHPYRADQNLRLGTSYDPKPVETRMFFAADKGDFTRTVLRCVGVGECRKRHGTMCPSYKATLEEKHSTRGRAHLLFEMLNGDREGGVLKDGWREQAVKEALDLCLSCKACKHECPVKVDMAAYKAEFLSHYYESHARPLSAPAFGFIDRWAHLASHAPGLVNALTQHEPIAGWIKRATGIARQRRLPAFASTTFTAGFKPGIGPAPKGEVLLWPDTFNNNFHPQIAHDAAEVLQRAGWRVRLPKARVCCGRPLYEAGYLDQARRYLEHTLDVLADEIRQGVPVVVLEPACLSVFQEEMPMMLPRHEQAHRLKQQSLLLPDFLRQHAPDLQLNPLQCKALVHLHCHHKSVLGTDGEHDWFRRLQLQVEEPDSGCCGMAGSFGFEAGKYDVSMKCAERALLPAVRDTGGTDLVIADGYSCREQIAQSTGRTALHLAQVLRMALDEPERA